MEKRLRLADDGPYLWTRRPARGLRERLEDQAQELATGDTMVMDLEGVEAFDYSFANEFFGKTVISFVHEYPGRFLVVENLTEDTRLDLTNALESLGLVLIERNDGRFELLGKFHPADRESFDAIVRAKGGVTAASLKDELGVNLTAMNERLVQLTSRGLIRREKGASPAGREQYRYWPPG